MNATKFEDFKKNLMKDENFREEYEALEPEYEIVKAMIKARKESEMTQSDLAKASGVAQSDISKLENGNANPTIKMLQRLANSMDMHLNIEFVPNH